MRILNRNKQSFKYCKYLGYEDFIDENNLRTGDKIISYSEPIELKGSISIAHGYTQLQLFGQSLDYDKIIILDDVEIEIDEKDLIFVDCEPTFEDGVLINRDYSIHKIAKSLNYISIAIIKSKETYED